jgi:hypothetical protein
MDLELNFDMNTVENQKIIAQQVMKLVEIIDPTCIVAGGAPRDWYMQKPAKDVDIFVNSPYSYSNCSFLIEQLKALGIEAKPAIYNSLDASIYRKNPDIAGVLDFEFMQVKFQVILCRKGTYSMLDSFPFGICQAWWKPSISEAIRTTKAFDRSLKHKALVRLQEAYGNDDFFVKKIKEKFPDWKYYLSCDKLAMDLLDK